MIERFSKNLLGLIFQFMDGKDLLRLESVSRKVGDGAKQDYIWRYLVENTLEVSQKYFLDTWKQCYWRNCNAVTHMTPENFNYQMCPIRHFKKVVTHLESLNNFVVAVDESGKVGVFLIDEKDMENDDDSLKIFSFETEGVAFMKLLSKSMELIIFTKAARILVFKLDQTSYNTFACEQVRQIDLPINPLSLYIAQLDPEGDLFYVCNLPLAAEEFQKDQSIFIVNIHTMALQLSQVLEFNEDLKDSVQEFYNWASVNNRQSHWTFYFNNHHRLIRVADIPQDMKKYQLAVYNGQRLIFTLFNKSLVVLDTSMSKTEMFLKKGNYWRADPFANDSVGPAVNLKHHQGLLFSHNISEINILDYNTVLVLQKILIGQDARSMIQISPHQDLLISVSFVQNQIHILKFKIDIKGKKVEQTQETKLDERHQINDLDMNRYLLASATTEGNVKLRRLNHLDQNPFFINAGSKTIKTNIPHPTKPGVSMVKAEQSKIIAVLGNVIRVYSFDIIRKKKA